MNHYHVSKVRYFICHLMKIKYLYLHVDLHVLGLISQALPTSRFAFVVNLVGCQCQLSFSTVQSQSTASLQ